MTEPHSTVLFDRIPAARGKAKQAGAAPTGSRRTLRAFAAVLEREAASGRHFTCLLTHDSELQRLNRDFLKKDYPTDVLSFPSPGPDGFLGEIAISFERASAQAAEHGHPVEDEIRILMLHGVLHLLGMDHQKDRGRMARAEREYRSRWGLPEGVIERVRR